ISLATVFAGDDVSGSATGTFSDKNVGTGRTVTVGTVSLSGADAGNYIVGTAASTMADISTASLTVTANPASKVIGETDPPLTFSTSGLVGGETEAVALAGTLSRQPGETVGDYEILQGSLVAVADNYDITFVSANFAITAGVIPDVLIGNATVNEADGTAAFAVTLTSPAVVEINLTLATANGSATAGTDFVANVASVTIPAGSTAATATFNVAILDDLIDEDDETFTVSVQSVDSGFVGSTSVGLGTITDNDTAGISVSAISGSTSETGGSATFTVVLNSVPTGNVVIDLSSSDVTEGTMSPSSLVFTPSNWNAVQTVTVTGLDDALSDSDVTYNILTAAATSTDANYDGLDAADVSVTNIDNDARALTLSIAPLSISEAGGTATGTITRNDEDLSSSLTVNLASGDTSEATVPATVTIPAGSASANFTITAVDDTVADGTQVLSISASKTGYVGYSAGLNVTDNENPALTMSINPLSISEAGGTATGTVTRNDEDLSSSLTVNLASSDTTEATVPSTVTIPAGAASVDFAITAVDDFVVDGTQVLSISASADGYVGYSTGLNVTDNDVAGFSLLGPTTIQVAESGTTETFSVVLTAAPVSSVVVRLDGTDSSEAVVSPTSLVFTSANWNQPQTVTVTGVDDLIDDGTQTSLIVVSIDDDASDGAFANVADQTVQVLTEDDDTAGFTTSPNTGLLVVEGGATDIVSFVLNSQPTADVTFDVVNGSADQVTFSQTTLTFTPSNWNIPQDILITAIDDNIAENSLGIVVLPQPAVSADPRYNGLRPQGANGSILDNDTRGVSVSEISGDTSENGSSATFSVVLQSEPTDVVTIPLSSSDPSEGSLFVSSVVFTPSNWNIPQSVTVTGVDDNVVDGTIAYSVVTGTIGGISDYAGINPNNVAVANQDNDVLTLTLSLAPGSISEAAGSATGTVTRNDGDLSQPLTVTLTSSDLTEATVPAEVTIPAGASSATFTVLAVDDSDIDGTQNVVISATAGGYVGGTSSLSVTDDDISTENVPPVIASISSSSQQTPSGVRTSVLVNFTDGNPGDVHFATIDWGDGVVTQGVVTEAQGAGTVAGQHVYQEPGVYVITVTINDGNGGQAVAATTTMVTGIKLVDGTLVIVGTDLNDTVSINIVGKKKLRVHASFIPKKGFVDFNLRDVERIEVWLGAGDDSFSVAGNIDIPVAIMGGAGFDLVQADDSEVRFLDATRSEIRAADIEDSDRDRDKRVKLDGFSSGLQQAVGLMKRDTEQLDTIFGRMVDAAAVASGSDRGRSWKRRDDDDREDRRRRKDDEDWSWCF
ncbi:MAG: hypothetical protein KDA81_14650, partial [Planctomycetaceae bacterium]|nr:hypothetical protein [Planctomycetaceae bacterium]